MKILYIIMSIPSPKSEKIILFLSVYLQLYFTFCAGTYPHKNLEREDTKEIEQ